MAQLCVEWSTSPLKMMMPSLPAWYIISCAARESRPCLLSFPFAFGCIPQILLFSFLDVRTKQLFGLLTSVLVQHPTPSLFSFSPDAYSTLNSRLFLASSRFSFHVFVAPFEEAKGGKTRHCIRVWPNAWSTASRSGAAHSIKSKQIVSIP